MSKHTPGPWELFEHSWSDSSICAGEKNSKHICSLSIYYEATEETQQELEREMDANARLISAAPDLLEALNRFDVDGLELQGDEEIDITMTAEDLRILRAAIAKAKGSAHE